MNEVDTLFNFYEMYPPELYPEYYGESIQHSITLWNIICSHLGFAIGILNHIYKIDKKIGRTHKLWNTMGLVDKEKFPKPEDFSLAFYWKDNKWLLMRNYLSTAVLMVTIPSICIYFDINVWNNFTALCVGLGSYALLKILFDRGVNKLKI